METLEAKKEECLDLSKYDSIPALDEAIKDIEEGRVSKPMTIEEFKVFTQKLWDEA